MQPFSRFARYFTVVAQEGGLRRAAEKLHVSASAIDRQILRAEEEFGVALFERFPHGLKLTSAGEFLLADLQRWRRDHVQTLERFAELQGLKRGHVSIAMIEAVSEGWLPIALARLTQRYPGLTLDLRVLPNDTVVSQLLSADADIGILLDPGQFPLLNICASLRIPMGVAMPAEHPLAQKVEVVPSDLATYRQLLPSAPLRVAGPALEILMKSGSRPEDSFHCNDIGMMRGLIRARVGIAVLSQIDVAEDVAAGALVFKRLGERWLKPVSLGIATTPHRQLSRAAQAVLEELVQPISDGLPITATRENSRH